MNRKKRVLTGVVALCACVFIVAGCGRASEEKTVLASIGSQKVTLADFNERISNLPPEYQDIVKKRKQEYLQDIINDTLLYQEAIRNNTQKNKEVVRVIEEAKKKIIVARFLKDEVDDTIEITEEDVEEFYDNNKDRYMTPEMMRVSHILVQSSVEANDIREQLKKGANFEDLARAKSVDPSAQDGGDIGYFPKGQLMPAFDNACAQLDIGETSDVVKTKLGYHIIKLTDRKPPQPRPLQDVAKLVRAQLYTLERQNKFNELLGRLRAGTRVEINEEILISGSEESNG